MKITTHQNLVIPEQVMVVGEVPASLLYSLCTEFGDTKLAMNALRKQMEAYVEANNLKTIEFIWESFTAPIELVGRFQYRCNKNPST